MCTILNTHFDGPLQLKEFNFSYLFLRQWCRDVASGIDIDYPVSAIWNQFLFCQDACQCLMLHPYITVSRTMILSWIRALNIDSSGQTLYQAVSWRVILQSSMLQRFTAESSRELSALRKLNNKQKQVSMFLILLFKLLTQLPFVSFLFSLLPFSILSLLPLPHPFFLFWSILCLPKT